MCSSSCGTLGLLVVRLGPSVAWISLGVGLSIHSSMQCLVGFDSKKQLFESLRTIPASTQGRPLESLNTLGKRGHSFGMLAFVGLFSRFAMSPVRHQITQQTFDQLCATLIAPAALAGSDLAEKF